MISARVGVQFGLVDPTRRDRAILLDQAVEFGGNVFLVEAGVRQVEVELSVEGVSERLIFGTDWPLQVFALISPWYHIDEITLEQAKGISALSNLWDRDVALKLAMGHGWFDCI